MCAKAILPPMPPPDFAVPFFLTNCLTAKSEMYTILVSFCSFFPPANLKSADTVCAIRFAWQTNRPNKIKDFNNFILLEFDIQSYSQGKRLFIAEVRI